MAINQIQLPQLQRRIPDIAGQFIRGRQDKRAEDRQNRLLTIQEGNVGVQREQQAAQDKKDVKTEERAAAAEERRVQAEARAQSAEARKAGDAKLAKQEREKQAEITFTGRSADLLSKVPPEELQAAWQQTLKTAITEGISVEGLPATLTQEYVAVMQREAALGGYKPAGSGGLASAKTEILADGSVVQALPNGEVQVRDPSGKIVTGQARLDVLSQSRESSLDKKQKESNIAVDAEAKKVEAVAKAKAKSAPLIAETTARINTQVKLADKAATERGEVMTDLSRAKAALPGLLDVVGKLRELAPIATSTFGGRVWDVAVKETGFGATKGKTASTKFGAMVNNQVLPLLKPTFGAAFTVPEGDALRATMGDVDASVEEKMATLDAFIEQKQRDIETKERQLGGGDAPIDDAGSSGVSDSDLLNKYL